MSLFFTNCKSSVEGKLSWNQWGDCNVSCGGGLKLRTAKACVPSYARCYDMQIIEEVCNEESCPVIPEGPSTYIPPGTIISWVPKPNKSSTSSGFPLNDDTWVICDGVTTCKKGLFTGQACSDLSDRALIGSGRTGAILDLQDASMPDHEHQHKHSGSHKYTVRYRRVPDNPGSKKDTGFNDGSIARSHTHTYSDTTTVTVNFSDMNEESAPVTRILASKVKKSTNENELYSPNLRVRFLFKCY